MSFVRSEVEFEVKAMSFVDVERNCRIAVNRVVARET
jgi:hypothetical protein